MLSSVAVMRASQVITHLPAVIVIMVHAALGHASDFDRYLRLKVTAEGLGPLRLGMSVDEFQAATRSEFQFWNREEAPECFYAVTAQTPNEEQIGLRFVMVKGRLDAIQIGHSQIRTEFGLGVGSTEAAVRDAFPGRVRVKIWQESGLVDKANAQQERQHVLVVENLDRRTEFIFGIDAGVVTGFAVGTLGGIVEAYDGCL